MKLQVTNTIVTITETSGSMIRDIDRATAPFKKGYRFNRAYTHGSWDGKEHLIKRGSVGVYYAPIGILKDIIRIAKEWSEPLEITDSRRIPSDTDTIKTDWNTGWVLRDYQKSAIESVIDTPISDVTAGKGLLRLPTRSGKTVIAAGIIDKLRVKTLFLVQSEMLLTQTIQLFQKVLRVPIGKIGGGVWDLQDITVASCQSLSRNRAKEQVMSLYDSIDLVIFDECHHLEGETWRQTLNSFDAAYKIGLSATIYLENDSEGIPKGTIWIKAATGDILYSMVPSDLIRMGYLVRPTIKLIKISGDAKYSNYNDAYDQGLINNLHRNLLIVDITRQGINKGYSTLVVANRIEHIVTLANMMEESGIRYSIIIGSTKPSERREIVDKYNNGDIDVLLGTVFGEGVDIPKIELVINAQGGKSKQATMQRFRNLTPSEGKIDAIFVDFMDLTSKWLADHSLQRLRIYRENEEFIVEILEDFAI